LARRAKNSFFAILAVLSERSERAVQKWTAKKDWTAKNAKNAKKNFFLLARRAKKTFLAVFLCVLCVLEWAKRTGG
jgi:hypothetical protein